MINWSHTREHLLDDVIRFHQHAGIRRSLSSLFDCFALAMPRIQTTVFALVVLYHLHRHDRMPLGVDDLDLDQL